MGKVDEFVEPLLEPEPEPLPDPVDEVLELVAVNGMIAADVIARQLVALVHATPMSGPALPLRVVG